MEDSAETDGQKVETDELRVISVVPTEEPCIFTITTESREFGRVIQKVLLFPERILQEFRRK